LDQDGEMVGILPLEDALKKAYNAGVDLLEISPQMDPPVCKIADYGKYRYEQQKKKQEAKKKQKTADVKEIKFRPFIEQHDYDVKLKKITQFLEAGHKVKLSLRFRGREMAHKDLGMEVFSRIKDATQDLAKTDFGPKMEGRQILMVLSPA
jgi:translation initiation factor IF-3